MTRNLFLAFAILLTGGTSVWAQAASSELYGEGVHRFFARDYQGADQLLTEAIDKRSQDPRAYYFRGLSREMFGGGGEGDFEEGARLEANGRSGPMISYSLARIQGHVRAKIEKARRVARTQAAQQRALQQQAEPPAAEVVPGANVPPAQTVDPFSGEGVRSGETEMTPPPVKPEVNDANTDPFGDEKKPADSSDPFGATTPPATEPAGEPDPFK